MLVRFCPCHAASVGSSILLAEYSPWCHLPPTSIPPLSTAQVPQDSILELTVYDFDRWSSNEVLGSLEIDITEEVARAPKGDVTRTWELEDVPLDWMKPGQTREKSTITMRIQWIPYAEQHRGRHFVNDPGHKK